MRRSVSTWLLLAMTAAACGTNNLQPTPPTQVPSASSPIETGGPSPTLESTPTSPTTPPKISVQEVLKGLDHPVDVAWRPNDPSSLFVVDQIGGIHIVRDGKLIEPLFLDIANIVTAGGERGLLGLAFLPSGKNGRFFIYYTALNGDQTVASYDTMPNDPDRADPKSARIWLTMPDKYSNHNGGSLVFGPDGYLYIGTGDGGGGGDPLHSGRRLDTLLAKVLRIDVSGDPPSGGSGTAYRIPPDNPFVDMPDARPEIWLTGLRNPWRIRFDRANGDLWIADVGQSAWEEIDVVRAGQKGLDFGWNTMEGAHCFRDGTTCDRTGLTLPVAEYGHDAGCSVTGGVVYRGSASPALDGWYVLADYCSGTFWAIDAATASSDDTETPVEVARTDFSISSIAEDASGELYATDLSRNAILRIGVGGS